MTTEPRTAATTPADAPVMEFHIKRKYNLPTDTLTLTPVEFVYMTRDAFVREYVRGYYKDLVGYEETEYQYSRRYAGSDIIAESWTLHLQHRATGHKITISLWYEDTAGNRAAVESDNKANYQWPTSEDGRL